MINRRQLLVFVPMGGFLSGCHRGNDACSSGRQEALDRIFTHIRKNILPLEQAMAPSDGFNAHEVLAVFVQGMKASSVRTDEEVMSVLSQAVKKDALEGRFVHQKNTMRTHSEMLFLLIANGTISLKEASVAAALAPCAG